MDMTSVHAGNEKKQQAGTILVTFASGIIFLGLALSLADREPPDTPSVIPVPPIVITAGPAGTSDAIALAVSSTVPAERALAVPINAKIVATFSEVLKSSTTNTITFTLKQGTTSVSVL